MLITCLLKIVAFRADHQVKCKCWWLLHAQNCVKLHHMQIHHGGNGMKCDFSTREVEISTSFFTVYICFEATLSGCLPSWYSERYTFAHYQYIYAMLFPFIIAIIYIEYINILKPCLHIPNWFINLNWINICTSLT